MDVERMLNGRRGYAALLQKSSIYPGSSQPDSTRSGDLWHYLSGISLMYAQTGDNRFLQRIDYMINPLAETQQKISERMATGYSTLRRTFFWRLYL